MSSLCFHLYVNLSRNSSLLKLNLNACPLEPELIKIRETTFFFKNFIGRLMIEEKLAKFRFQLLSFGLCVFGVSLFQPHGKLKTSNLFLIIGSVSDC